MQTPAQRVKLNNKLMNSTANKQIDTMQNSEDNLLELIAEYVSCVKYSCSFLREIYNGDETFLYAYKILKLIPKEGRIDEVYYNFHGKGCSFDYSDFTIEVDFGFDGRRCDGFDLYRIELFYRFRIEKYTSLLGNKLEDTFNAFMKKGFIAKHPQDPNGTLFYLSSSLKESM